MLTISDVRTAFVFFQILTFPLVPLGIAFALSMGLVMDLIVCLLWIITFGYCFQCCTFSCRVQAIGQSRNHAGSPTSDWETCQGGDELCEQFVRLDTMFDGGYSPFELCTGGFVNWPLYRCITCQFVCPGDASDGGDVEPSSSGGPIIYRK
eukprot:TRINITY_DN2293_c0_g1_i2.p1 TRINITY_DN2293_c0_g1~~TRINITY_DN2293_c0_g1_i2.p1  ORF type:complete len:151 (+),score=9.47 TRINITY_DN2293_c0_g1_i2:56-508(+)